MTLDLKLLDMSNPENIKQHIINNFQDYDLPIIKIKKAKDGYFVYHNQGMPHKRKIRTLVEEGEGFRKYAISYKVYGLSFVDTTDAEVFANYLEMAIAEGLRREPINV